MKARRGVALILVLWIVVLLTSVTAVASSAARSSGDVVATLRAQATARSMAESGITAAVTGIDNTMRDLERDSTARATFLNSLDAGVVPNAGRASAAPTPLGDWAHDTLGDGAFAVAVVDVSARLDVNEAGEAGLTKFLSAFVPVAEAQVLASRIVARISDAANANDPEAIARMTRDSLMRALLGRSGPTSRVMRPMQSLDELSEIAGLDERLLSRIVPYLTVDGDARINRVTAPPEVRIAATGSLVDSPARFLLIARGWRLGHPLTREIQAVYDVSETGLRLVRWREREL